VVAAPPEVTESANLEPAAVTHQNHAQPQKPVKQGKIGKPGKPEEPGKPGKGKGKGPGSDS
jgi:hypothetical protein